VEGWIKLHRLLQKWEWYNDSQTLHIFITILLNANHEDGKWRGHTVKRGQWITGRKKLSEITGVSERSIRTILVRLTNSGELTIKPTNKFSLITVVNWDSYQIDDNQSDQLDASNRPATDQQPTTNKNDKNEENEKEDIYRDELIKKLQRAFGAKFNSLDFQNLPTIMAFSEKQIDEGLKKSKGKNPNYLITVLQNMPEEKEPKKFLTA
jgi:hypothetical protein